MNSQEIIGRVRDRFKELEHKEWDYRSFYNGWLEGRVDLLKQTPISPEPPSVPTDEEIRAKFDHYANYWNDSLVMDVDEFIEAVRDLLTKKI